MYVAKLLENSPLDYFPKNILQ